jgi:hypothetical protein
MECRMRLVCKLGVLFMLAGALVWMPGCGGSNSSGSTTLTFIAVTPLGPTITQGQNQQFAAMGTYSDFSNKDITTSVTWSSSSPSVATISNSAGSNGLATSMGSGSTTIQATMGSVMGSTKLTVQPTLASIAVTPANPTIAQGQTEQFTATGTYSDASMQDITTSVRWSSSKTSVATVSSTPGSIGLATTFGSGSTTIQATLGAVSGSTGLTVTATSVTLIRLVVSPQYPSIIDSGAAQAFTATGHYSDGSTQDLTSTATWTSSNATVATVNSSGMATSGVLGSGQAAGFSSIQASVSAAGGSVTGVSILSVTKHTGNGFAGVFMHHNNISRTGQNVNETTLTTANVNSTTFGKLFSQTVDGFIYAQPLYVPNVTIGGVVHNVVYVATEGDSLYAFDADSNTGANANPLWHANLIDTNHGAAPGATTVNIPNSLYSYCVDLVPQVGITSTPSIDPSTSTMYVETKSQEGANFVHRLHAIDITTGNEKAPGPVVISASVSGTGDGSSNGTLVFDALHHLNRPGLLLLNGIVYVAYASHCDVSPYHGWLFAYDTKTFTQQAVYVTTPNGGLGGIWMAGAGVAADSSGNIFVSTGNGDFDTTDAFATEFGDTIVKLSLGGSAFSVLDYFTPFDQGMLQNNDTDLGSGGVVLLPDQPGSHPHELAEVGKEGTIYIVDRDQMTTADEHYCPTGAPTNCTSDPEIVQELQDTSSQLWGTPAYWNNSVYFWGTNDAIRDYTFGGGLLSQSPASSGGLFVGFPSPTASISANGTTNAIAWAIDATNYGAPGPAVLHAFDATNVSMELYNSSQVAGDQAGAGVKFSVPMIANGKVYIGTQTELDVYGVLP